MSFENEEFEHRLATVEAALSQVQEKLGLAGSPPNWVERISGSLADIPDDDYQQFLECCRTVRNGESVSEAQEPRP